MPTEDPWDLPIGESIVRSVRLDVKDGEPIGHPRVRITRVTEDRLDIVPVDEDGLTWSERARP